MRNEHNTLRHRWVAHYTAISTEGWDRLVEQLAHYEDMLEPRNICELDIVTDIVVNRWRMIRMQVMSKILHELEIKERRDRNGQKGPGEQSTLAMRASIDHSSAQEVLHRFEHRYLRNAMNALFSLFRLRRLVRAEARAARKDPPPPPSDEPIRSVFVSPNQMKFCFDAG